jgi:hypothetical protein
VPDDSALAHPSPVAAIEVHVGSADASRLKIYKHPSAFDFWLSDIFDSDVAWSTVDCGFQN